MEEIPPLFPQEEKEEEVRQSIAEADVFDVEMHYPVPVFRYSFQLRRHDDVHVGRFLEFLSELAPVIPLSDREFILLDEIDVKDIKFEVPRDIGLKRVKLEEVSVPRGKQLVDIYLALYRHINPFRYFHPSVHSNPIAMSLEEKGIEKGHEKWKKFDRFATFMKNRIILLEPFEENHIGARVMNVEFEEGVPEEGEPVKIKGKPLYGTVLSVRGNKVVIDFGIYRKTFDISQVQKVRYRYDFSLKKSDYRFVVDYFVEHLNNETIKFGYSIERAHLDFEELPAPDFETFFRNVKVKLEFEDERLKEKLDISRLPFAVGDSDVSITLDRKMVSQINRGNLKSLYMKLVERLIPFDMNVPRIYSSGPVMSPLEGKRAYVGGGFYSAVCRQDHAPVVGWYLKNYRPA